MGLLTGLLTLPLAPVRGTVWIAERLVEQAEAERGGASVERRLAELQTRFDLGEIDEEELERAEDELLAELPPPPGRAGRGEAGGG